MEGIIEFIFELKEGDVVTREDIDAILLYTNYLTKRIRELEVELKDVIENGYYNRNLVC